MRVIAGLLVVSGIGSLALGLARWRQETSNQHVTTLGSVVAILGACGAYLNVALHAIGRRPIKAKGAESMWLSAIGFNIVWLVMIWTLRLDDGAAAMGATVITLCIAALGEFIHVRAISRPPA